MFYCFPLGNRLRRFPRSRSKPALCPPYVFFTPSSRKRKTPKQNICETNRLISWPLGQVVKTSPFHGGNMGSNPVGVTTSWGYSSAGRARALQARGHRFEPCCPHHIKKRATLCVVLFLCVGKQHRARIRRVIRLCANHCAPVPRSHCTLASKCKHFRFAVDEPCCPRVAHFAFEVTLSLAIMLTLLLAYSLSPKVQSIFWGPHILKKAHQDDVLFLLYGTIYGREPNRMVGVRT